MSWRKLLAVFFGGTGLIWSISMFYFTASAFEMIGVAERVAQFARVAVAAIALAISFGVWHGRSWSLLAMRLVVWASLLCLACLALADLVTPHYGHAVVLRPLLENLATFAMFSCFPLFLLGVLYQPDVRSEFRRPTNVP